MPEKKYEEFEKEWEERQKNKSEESILVGQPVRWSDITEDEGKREWIWENYIAKGSTTLLSALWKAGKSTLLRALFVAIAQEEEFAGQPTTKSKILVLSEETQNEWYDQREEIDEELIQDILVWPKPLHIKPNIKQWVQMIEELAEKCEEESIDLVIIDTLSSFWPIDNENDSAQVVKALVPLWRLTNENIAVLLVHHFRKGGGDQAQASRGSGALPSFVDNIIEFTRNEQGSYTQRILKTYGRFSEVIPSVVIELTPEGKYETKGEPWQVSKIARLEKIVDIIKNNPSISSKEVFNIWSRENNDITLRSVQRYIKELFEKGFLVVDKEEAVASKKTPFYALKEGYSKQTTIDLPYTNGVVVSSAIETTSVASLSSANKNRAVADDTTTTSPIREIDDGWDPRI